MAYSLNPCGEPLLQLYADGRGVGTAGSAATPYGESLVQQYAHATGWRSAQAGPDRRLADGLARLLAEALLW